MIDNNTKAFFALLRAGLWGKDVILSPYGEIDFEEVCLLAEEQAVDGLVAAGLEHVIDVRIPQNIALTYAGRALQLERRNLAMNRYIETLIGDLREDGVYALLVKGQGIAQCYEKPLWRSCGDIDLFLSNEHYENAKIILAHKLLSLRLKLSKQDI